MEVAGAVKQKWRETRFVFAIKLLDQARRRGKAKLQTPLCCIEALERNLVAIPSAIEIDMQRGWQRISARRRALASDTSVVREGGPKIFRSDGVIRLQTQHLVKLGDGLRDLSQPHINDAQAIVNRRFWDRHENVNVLRAKTRLRERE